MDRTSIFQLRPSSLRPVSVAVPLTWIALWQGAPSEALSMTIQ